ncbi:OsmC family protein [Membranicola marinus]|uniref:OsmC family protein n=1 Tax=Membranihabitans marinus TaxID=1227546 RepID=A0A953LBW3_9BACT|nr:OsmC family protein [Membranihabitans marinus]MBY5958931.1 OsmC family protein [Membranihabitans marinus]
MSNLTFSVKGRNENATRFVANARHFQLIVDEPEELGGTDQAANPVEFLLAAYAGCLNVMGHIVAKELDIDLRSLEIDIEGDLDPSKVFGKPTVNRPGYQEIRVRLIPESDATQEQLKIWTETVESRCPVNDNLLNPTPVKLVVGAAVTA